MSKLTPEQVKQLQAELDRKIVDEMKAYKKSFLDFFVTYCNQKSIISGADTYNFGPFELWSIEKLANMKIAMDNQVSRISHEVKSILGEFLDQVTKATKDEDA